MSNEPQRKTKSHSLKAIYPCYSIGMHPETGIEEDDGYNCNGDNLKYHLPACWSQLPCAIEHIDDGIIDERNEGIFNDKDKQAVYFSGVIEI